MCVCEWVCTLTAQYSYPNFLLNLFLLYFININLDNWVLKWKGPDKSAWGTCTPHNSKNNSSSSSSSSCCSSSSSSGGGRGGLNGRILLCLIDFGRAKDTRLESYSSLLQPCKKGTSTVIVADDVSNRGTGTGIGVGVECHENALSYNVTVALEGGTYVCTLHSWFIFDLFTQLFFSLFGFYFFIYFIWNCYQPQFQHI